MPPRLPLTPSRVSQARIGPAYASASAYGSGLLFDLLTPALKFRARHASAHAMQQKVVDDVEGVCAVDRGIGRAGVQGNAEAGPSRWVHRAEQGGRVRSAEGVDSEAGAQSAEAMTGVQERGSMLAWSVKGKERSWLAMPPRLSEPTSDPATRAPSRPPRPFRSKRLLYPSPNDPHAGTSSYIARLNSDTPIVNRIYPSRQSPDPLSLIERYRQSPASRAHGELLARYARRMDNVKAEKDVRDIMGRARLAPAGYVKGKKRVRRVGVRYEKPPDPEEALLGGLGSMEELERRDLASHGGLTDVEVPNDAVAEQYPQKSVSDRMAGEGQADDQDQVEEQSRDVPPHRRQSKRRERKEKKLELAAEEAQAGEPMPMEAVLAEPVPPPPKHPKRPDRQRASNSLTPNIRATRAWPTLPTPRQTISPTHVLQCLHHRLLHPTRYIEALTLSDALDLMRLAPTYRPPDLLNVLHLYLAYARYPASTGLAHEYETYFRPGMPVFPYESPDIGSCVGESRRAGWTAQTLHLGTLSIMRSHLASTKKHDALRALIRDADQRGLKAGSETIRHLVRFCMAVNDQAWCRRLLDEWWVVHAHRRHSIGASSVDLSSPGNVDRVGIEHDPKAYDHVPFRFAHSGKQMQRWFRTLRRLERKGWVKRVGVEEDIAGRAVSPGRAWRGGYVWQGQEGRGEPNHDE